MSEKVSRLMRKALNLKDETTQGYHVIKHPNGSIQVTCTGQRATYKRLKRVLREMKRSHPTEYADVLRGMREQVYGTNTPLRLDRV